MPAQMKKSWHKTEAETNSEKWKAILDFEVLNFVSLPTECCL